MATEITRMRFFNGLFLTEQEFQLEQSYNIRMRRLLNRQIFGWGILDGLEVEPLPEPEPDTKPQSNADRLSIKVTSGVALNKIKVDGESSRQFFQEVCGDRLDENSKLDAGLFRVTGILKSF